MVVAQVEPAGVELARLQMLGGRRGNANHGAEMPLHLFVHHSHAVQGIIGSEALGPSVQGFELCDVAGQPQQQGAAGRYRAVAHQLHFGL